MVCFSVFGKSPDGMPSRWNEDCKRIVECFTNAGVVNADWLEHPASHQEILDGLQEIKERRLKLFKLNVENLVLMSQQKDLIIQRLVGSGKEWDDVLKTIPKLSRKVKQDDLKEDKVEALLAMLISGAQDATMMNKIADSSDGMAIGLEGEVLLHLQQIQTHQASKAVSK